MSGCLRLNGSPESRSAWIAAGWVFRNALEDIANEIKAEHSALAQRLIEATEGFEYLDLSAASAPEMRSVLRGAVATRDRWRDAGPSSFHDPAFFPGFIARLDDLIALLAQDERCRADATPGDRPPVRGQ